MIKDIVALLTKKSRSEMKGMDMGWEWNWPHKLIGDWGTTWFSFNINTSSKGDHSPSLHCSLVILNWCILDFDYHNAYHEVDDEDEF